MQGLSPANAPAGEPAQATGAGRNGERSAVNHAPDPGGSRTRCEQSRARLGARPPGGVTVTVTVTPRRAASRRAAPRRTAMRGWAWLAVGAAAACAARGAAAPLALTDAVKQKCAVQLDACLADAGCQVLTSDIAPAPSTSAPTPATSSPTAVVPTSKPVGKPTPKPTPLPALFQLRLDRNDLGNINKCTAAVLSVLPIINPTTLAKACFAQPAVLQEGMTQAAAAAAKAALAEEGLSSVTLIAGRRRVLTASDDLFAALSRCACLNATADTDTLAACSSGESPALSAPLALGIALGVLFALGAIVAMVRCYRQRRLDADVQPDHELAKKQARDEARHEGGARLEKANPLFSAGSTSASAKGGSGPAAQDKKSAFSWASLTRKKPAFLEKQFRISGIV